MQRWEYLSLWLTDHGAVIKCSDGRTWFTLDHKMFDIVSLVGAEGWEMTTSWGLAMYFKRPID